MPDLPRSEAATSHRLLVNRRAFLLGATALVAGCSATAVRPALQTVGFAPPISAYYAAMYAALPDERFPVPAVDVDGVNPRFFRQLVGYSTAEPPGTIVVDTQGTFLYLVLEDGQAMRYGVGVGREGLNWSGHAVVSRKAQWPRWTPTANMIARDPELERFAGGMEPGLTNPLGARALYLFDDGRDTLYRLHGTNEPWSIGRAMSSGCIRLFNQDIIDLYDRTPLNTRVLVLDHRQTSDSITSLGSLPPRDA